MTLGQNLIISDTVHLEGLKAKEIGTYQTSPKGQLCGRAYEVAVNGTQQTINSTSATAKLRISRLVVLRICLLKVTTKITKLFPRKPIRHTILSTTGFLQLWCFRTGHINLVFVSRLIFSEDSFLLPFY